MPIKDRTHRRLVRLGTIRLGIQVPNSRGNGTHPVQTDYFVLKDAPELIEVYGEQPRELDVLLPFPDVERNFDAWYQVWAGGVLVCQGDGEYVQYATPHEVNEDKRGVHVHNGEGDTLVSNGVAQVAFDWNGIHFEPGELVECPGASKDLYPHCAACRLNGLLKVMMADPALFRMGYYQISTGSKRNFDTIMGTLEMMPADRLNGIPFKLRLVEEQITYQDNGKRKKGKKWFIQLEPDPTLTRKLYKRATERMLDEPVQPIALPPPTGPDWDALEVDVPEPPPYVVDSVEEAQYVESAEITNGAIDGEVEVDHDWTRAEAKKLSTWWRNELVITDDQALGYLGVSKISEFQGDLDAARQAIEQQLALEAEAADG